MKTGLMQLTPSERRILIARVRICLKLNRTRRIAAIRLRLDAMIKAEELRWRDVFPDHPRWPRADAGIPKYCHPIDRWRTWSGHGRKPAWLREALKVPGASLTQFVIDEPREAICHGDVRPMPVVPLREVGLTLVLRDSKEAVGQLGQTVVGNAVHDGKAVAEQRHRHIDESGQQDQEPPFLAKSTDHQLGLSTSDYLECRQIATRIESEIAARIQSVPKGAVMKDDAGVDYV